MDMPRMLSWNLLCLGIFPGTRPQHVGPPGPISLPNIIPILQGIRKWEWYGSSMGMGVRLLNCRYLDFLLTCWSWRCLPHIPPNPPTLKKNSFNCWLSVWGILQGTYRKNLRLPRTQMTSIFEGQPTKTRPKFQPNQGHLSSRFLYKLYIDSKYLQVFLEYSSHLDFLFVNSQWSHITHFAPPNPKNPGMS